MTFDDTMLDLELETLGMPAESAPKASVASLLAKASAGAVAMTPAVAWAGWKIVAVAAITTTIGFGGGLALKDTLLPTTPAPAARGPSSMQPLVSPGSAAAPVPTSPQAAPPAVRPTGDPPAELAPAAEPPRKKKKRRPLTVPMPAGATRGSRRGVAAVSPGLEPGSSAPTPVDLGRETDTMAAALPEEPAARPVPIELPDLPPFPDNRAEVRELPPEADSLEAVPSPEPADSFTALPYPAPTDSIASASARTRAPAARGGDTRFRADVGPRFGLGPVPRGLRAGGIDIGAAVVHRGPEQGIASPFVQGGADIGILIGPRAPARLTLGGSGGGGLALRWDRFGLDLGWMGGVQGLVRRAPPGRDSPRTVDGADFGEPAALLASTGPEIAALLGRKGAGQVRIGLGLGLGAAFTDGESEPQFVPRVAISIGADLPLPTPGSG